jgi:hypothetical protein
MSSYYDPEQPYHDAAYWNQIVSQQSMRVSQEDSLAGETLISLETNPDREDTDFLTYVRENFESFVGLLRQLPPREQEMLLTYYMLSKPQHVVGCLCQMTQTICSRVLRQNVKAICCLIMYGGRPTEAQMRKEFGKADKTTVNSMWSRQPPVEVSLSHLLALYDRTRDYRAIAAKLGLARADVYRTIAAAAETLSESPNPRFKALGFFFLVVTYKTSRESVGLTAKERSKRVLVYRARDPLILGKFERPLNAPGIEEVFFAISYN